LLVEEDLAPAGGLIRAPELAETYLAMCLDLWWRPCRWPGRNGVAEHFRRLQGHPKTWQWFVGPDGRRRRLYVYPIPPSASGRERGKRTPKSAKPSVNRTPIVSGVARVAA
jgi:hypothetical protein